MRQNSQELVNTDHIFPGVYYKPEAEGFESKKHIVVKARGSNSIFLAVVLTRSLSNVWQNHLAAALSVACSR